MKCLNDYGWAHPFTYECKRCDVQVTVSKPVENKAPTAPEIAAAARAWAGWAAG